MEAANESGADRAFGVKSLDAETTALPSSTDTSAVDKPSQLFDHKPHGYVSNILVDLHRVNKGGAVRGKALLLQGMLYIINVSPCFREKAEQLTSVRLLL